MCLFYKGKSIWNAHEFSDTQLSTRTHTLIQIPIVDGESVWNMYNCTYKKRLQVWQFQTEFVKQIGANIPITL